MAEPLSGANEPVVAPTPIELLFGRRLDARTEGLIALVGVELTKAREKFAPFNSPHEGKAVIEEELDELWEHVKANTGTGSEAFWEAIQVAAMALRYAYDLSDISAWEVAGGRSASMRPDPQPTGAIEREVDLTAVGTELEERVKQALASLEKAGVSARDADEFIRDCVFNAWWDWDYEGPQDE